MVIGELAARAARRYPEKVGFVFEGKRTTFLEFNERVNRLANALLSIRKPGDTVAVLSFNSTQVLEIALALAKAGMVYTPINYRFTPVELPYVFNNSEATVLFVGPEFIKTIEDIRKELKYLKLIVPMEGQKSEERTYEKLLQEASSEEPELPIKDEDLYTILYTSGTTGPPKGVMLSHKNILAMLVDHIYHYQFGPDDVIVHIMPFYHSMEFTLALDHLYVGATNVITRKFDPKEFLAFIEKEKGTNTTLPPAALLTILDELDRGKYDVSTLKTIAYGGQPMPTELLRRGLQKLGKIFLGVYGLTELSTLCACLPKQLHVLSGPDSRLLASIGEEMISSHVRIIDDEGKDIRPGQLGEVIIKSDGVMLGYWKMPEEIAKTLKGGWLYSGDIATIDEKNYLYIKDRKKDLIISGAENISPTEIEQAIYKHPAVSECAVIGVPDLKWGEAIKAVVVLKKGATASEKEIIDFCRKYIADFKKPKSVDFVDALPKDPVGKLQKKVLKERYWKEQDRQI